MIIKRLPSIIEGSLGLLVLGALALAPALTFIGLPKGPGPASFVSPVHTSPLSPAPLPTLPLLPPALSTTPVPPCTFSGQPVPAESGFSLETYRFSEP